MLLLNQLKWAEWNITDALGQLFVLRWEELFSSKTIDTWRVRSLGVQDLLDELVDTAIVAQDHEPYRGNIKHIVDEVNSRIKLDSALSDSFPLLRDHIARIEKEIDLAGIVSKAKFALEYLQPYDDVLSSNIDQLLEANDDQHKSKLYSQVVALGTQKAALGYSIRYLGESMDRILLSDPTSSFRDRVSSLVTDLQGQSKPFSVSFAVDWPGPLSAAQFGDTRFTFSSAVKTNADESPASEFFSKYQQSQIITVEVTASDPFAALELATAKFSDLVAILRLYKVKGGIQLKGDQSVIEFGDEQICASRSQSSLFSVKDSGQSEKLMAQAIKMQSHLSSADANQIMSALHYHELALASNSATASLVNLWIALEALTRSGFGESAIERVCRYVVPSVAIDNPQKILAAMAMDIRYLWSEKDIGEYLGKLNYSKDTRLDPRDLLRSLRDVQDGELIEPLYSIVGDHRLMCHRVHKYRSGAFKDTGSVFKMVQKNASNIQWQLRRIYRARNDIVHRGQTQIRARHLVDHLHSYFIRFVNNVIASLVHHPDWTLRDAIEIQCQLFDMLDRRAQKGEQLNESWLMKPHLLATS